MCTRSRTCLIAAVVAATVRVWAQGSIPTDWIDPDTGHRVVRLSREDGSQSSYFHQNEFTPDGRKLIFTSPTGLYAVDLQTRAIEQIRAGRTGLLCVGRKTGRAYYLSRGEQGLAICAVNPDTKEDKKIVDVPRGISIANINCDETLAGGTFDLKRPAGIRRTRRPATAATLRPRGTGQLAGSPTRRGRSSGRASAPPTRTAIWNWSRSI